MAHLIDKDAVLAEIERLFNEHSTKEYCDEAGVVLNQLEDFLDILEVKEVDLEKEIKEEYLERRHYGGRFNMLIILNESQFNDIAKHFFELGLKAQKGEKV